VAVAYDINRRCHHDDRKVQQGRANAPTGVGPMNRRTSSPGRVGPRPLWLHFHPRLTIIARAFHQYFRLKYRSETTSPSARSLPAHPSDRASGPLFASHAGPTRPLG
jgi:hypothetical protein